MQVRLVALVPVLGLALTGCSGGEPQAKPSSLPPVSASPSPSPTPSPSASPVPVPAAVATNTKLGARFFAAYYMDVLSEANLSGDVSVLEPLGDPKCGECKAFVDTIRSDSVAGTTFTGGRYSVQGVIAAELAPGDYLVTLSYDRAPSTTTDTRGMIVRDPALTDESLQFRVKYQRGRWQVLGIRETPST